MGSILTSFVISGKFRAALDFQREATVKEQRAAGPDA